MEVPVHSKQEIYERLGAHKAALHDLGVERIGLFGSFVRDEHNESSDVDMLVDFRPGEETFDHFMELCFFLERIFHRHTEVVTRESLSPYIGPHILKTVEYVKILD